LIPEDGELPFIKKPDLPGSVLDVIARYARPE
jgi:hypothetical protein